MYSGNRSAGRYQPCISGLMVLLLAGSFFLPGCSKDPAAPEPPAQRTTVTYVSYFDANNFDLMCATKTGDSWGIRTVDSQDNVGWFTSIAVDKDANPHIAYHDGRNYLKYATKSDGAWETEIVDSQNIVYDRSIALDAQGNPHIIYCANSCAGEAITCIKYAVRSGDSWQVELVESNCGGNQNLLPSIAVDAQGHPHVVYYYQRTTDLRYAVKTGGVWEIEFADETADNVGSNCCVALDSGGNPHVSYWNTTQNHVAYATKSGGVWEHEVLTNAGLSGGLHGHRTSIALDRNDNPHIAYGRYPEDLAYAVKGTGGGWNFEVVDSDGKVGAYPSLAFDPQGNPCISYLQYTSGYDLKCATKKDGVWEIETVDPWGNRGEYCSMAIGSH